jgi:hypothetical protein
MGQSAGTVSGVLVGDAESETQSDCRRAVRGGGDEKQGQPSIVH